MRLILEKSDLVEIIAKHFNARVDPDSVVVRHDPFEVELRAFDKLEFKEADAVASNASENPTDVKPNTRRLDENATSEPPVPTSADAEDLPDDGASPLSIIARSEALKNELDRAQPQVEPRRAHSGSNATPGDFRDEIT